MVIGAMAAGVVRAAKVAKVAKVATGEAVAGIADRTNWKNGA
ncbi:hypothetical protein AK972_4537 [Pseudomonas yamanorum]|nr:hypothetical protein AK972_4537 [Pseudomonas yamanorum]